MDEHGIRLKRAEGLYRKWCGLLFGALALIITLLVLFAGDDIGLSNNGDFVRVMRLSSLSFSERLPAYTYEDTFVIDLSHGSAPANLRAILLDTEGLESYPSVHVLIVRLSVVLNLVVNKLMGWEMSTYHIGVLGFMYALLYAAGIGFLLSQFRLRRLWKDVLVKAAALVVLCDVGYVAYFNSLYGEGLEHIALIWCAAMLVRVLTRRPTAWDGVWCALAALLYGSSKFFNIPLAILTIAVLEGIVLIRSGKKRVLAFGGAAVAALVATWMVVPGWMDTETNYNAAFYGVVRNVDRNTAEKYLTDMGLPAELADYKDTNYYTAGVQSSLAERGLLDKANSVKKTDLLLFYLTHPVRLWEQANLTALHCGMIRPFYLANHGEGYPLLTFSGRMSLWSTFRDWLCMDTLWGYIAVTAAAIIMAIFLGRKRMRRLLLVLILLAMLGGLCFAYLMPIILNGEGDLAKHMFAYGELIDLLLLAILVFAVDRAGRERLYPAVGLALTAALVLPPLCAYAAGTVRDNLGHAKLENGAYVTLGSYEGKALTWLVAEETEDGFTLLCADENISLPFDSAGSNYWSSASLREWLNGDFLSGFAAGETELLQSSGNPVILPDRLRYEAEQGDMDFACSHIAVLADRFHERAYRITTTDTVMLPGIELAAQLARDGRDIAGRAWWLETPYCPSDTMVRYVGADGHIYFGDVTAERTVRPVVKIVKTKPRSGSGSRRDPFVLP